MLFVAGLSIGIGSTVLVMVVVLALANDIPLLSPLHIFVEIYLQIQKCWHRITMNQFDEVHRSEVVADLEKYRALPFVRVLPATTPSGAARTWNGLVLHQKVSTFVKELKRPYRPSRVNMLRRQMKFSEPMFNLYDRGSCAIRIEYVPSRCPPDSARRSHSVPIHVIEYEGSSMSNGVILCLHGGGFVAGMPSMHYAVCCQLSKLTAAVCVSVDYRLCPDDGVTITDALDDCWTVYRHLVAKLSSSKRICVMGESAGGTLALLLMQRIKAKCDTISSSLCDSESSGESESSVETEQQLDPTAECIGNPACCWVCSPWTDLSMDADSVAANKDLDVMLALDPQRIFQRMAIGEIDINLRPRYQSRADKPSLVDPAFSPLYGEWAGLSPIYFTVGATEMLRDDTLRAAQRAFDAGCSVKVDIAPFEHHTWPLFQRTLPEARDATVRAADFILNHLDTC